MSGLKDNTVMVEAVTSEVAGGVLALPGYEKLTKRSETRILRLAAGESIELIMGEGHIIRLRRGKDYVVRISVDGFKLPGPDKAEVLSDEVELPMNASVEIRRDQILADNKLDLKRVKNHDESLEKQIEDYHLNFPNRAVNFQGQNIDFTDIESGPFSGLSIMIGVSGRRAEDNMIFIANHDVGLGVAVPAAGAE